MSATPEREQAEARALKLLRTNHAIPNVPALAAAVSRLVERAEKVERERDDAYAVLETDLRFKAAHDVAKDARDKLAAAVERERELTRDLEQAKWGRDWQYDKAVGWRERCVKAEGRERELTRALTAADEFFRGDLNHERSVKARTLVAEALAGGVSAAGRPPEQDCPCPPAFKRVAYCDDCPERQEPGGGTAAVAEAGKRPWRGEMRFCFVAESQDEAGDILDAATAAMESLGVFAEGGSCEVMDNGDVLAESPLAAALTTATAKRSHQEVVPAAPEVLPEETP